MIYDRNTIYAIGDTLYSSSCGYNNYYIRPVINLKKDKIESGCGVKNELYDYEIGETLIYNNTSYCVINDSKTSDDYVTLIKNESLTYDELIENKGNLSIEYFQNDNNIELTYYYQSDTCHYRNNYSECNNNYDTSFIKTVVNNWSNSFNSDLKEVDGYKVRLLNIDELFENLGYDRGIRVTDSVYSKTYNVPSCIYNSNYSHWTMSGLGDSDNWVYIIRYDRNLATAMIGKQCYTSRY